MESRLGLCILLQSKLNELAQLFNGAFIHHFLRIPVRFVRYWASWFVAFQAKHV